ncbi:hypothetical protein IMG5_108960 [Ichthyophthirius multifiliis]|uniref:asparagine--tRNA ligase n=1 Tax=Ichthyophthirius multifiliis TaxID=5932 RepID=G0QTJ6_ICHMU|nr:hypothetical protein IMG5_108960 [Ichthyophthirius multifiliis]EGR31447.1 hypothetical protein IMG5_108960 [Ichthyophthirius multifiliis]|eukprot:XP_004034933.1 hypothetical protein IMG5_108960 [Ichthyophthirius multifiliis]
MQESDEMRNTLLFKYLIKPTTKQLNNIPQANTGNNKEKQQQPLKQKQPEKPFTYDFSNELKQIKEQTAFQRFNQPNQYKVPEQFSYQNKPQYLVGNIERISNILIEPEKYIGKEGTISGWSKTVRSAASDTIVFIELNDGSCVKNLQIVVNKEKVENFAQILKTGIATSYRIHGLFVKSEAKGQVIELQLTEKNHSIQVIGNCDAKVYPIAKKKHTLETLREHAHLRPRSNTIGAVARVRNNLSYATHIYFQSNGFQYIHTPIITASDCEGAGEMFQVTTVLPKPNLEAIKIPKNKKQLIDYTKDFFKKPSFLTVSGQLSVETFCCALSNVYTFGPTFRAEVSHTTRHLAEFWMIEPEIAFADVYDVIECAEGYIKFCLDFVLKNNRMDLEFLQQQYKPDLITYLEDLIKNPFARISYTEAISLLEKAIQEGKIFENKVYWGCDLATEHERFIAEYIFKRPVAVYNYPKEIKSFYMKLNPDGKTVAAFDMLVPQIGELVGGSQREEVLEVLEKRMKECDLIPEDYWWYLDLRKYGTVPHGGFGLGFERLCMLSTGIDNIRDVIPFPRWHGNAEF